MARKPKIMIVDDSALIREWMERTLVGAGYEVVTREIALGAGNMVLSEKPDLLILDVSMPALDGDKLAQVIRKHETGRRLPIVLCSTLPLEELRRRAKQCDADGIIPKPDDEAEFVRQVERFLPALSRKAPAALSPRLQLEREHAGRGQVLVVGAETLRHLVATALPPASGLTIVAAPADHEAARQLAGETMFVLVVIDIGAAAPEASETLRIACVESAIPVVLLSAQLDADLLRRVHAMGVSHALPAPGSAALLRIAVRDLLRIPDPRRPALREVEFPPRIAVQATVHLDATPTHSAPPPIEAVTWDLDEGAAVLCSRHAPPLLATACIAFAPSSQRPAVLHHCQVAQLRSQPVGPFPRGFGVNFTPQSADEGRALRSELQALLHAAGG